MFLLKNLFKQEKGATSVLVIFMMIVLVTLGAFTISSANVNYRLAESVKKWNSGYYQIESLGEEYVMDIDIVLTDALTKAIDYIMNEGYRQPTYEDIPQDLQTEIYTKFSENNSQENVDFAFRQTYMYYSLKGIEELSYTYSSQEITPTYSGNSIEEITTKVNLVSPINETSKLSVSLVILPLENYFLEYDQGETVISQITNEPKYNILEWKQWNVPKDLEHPIDVWGSDM